MCRFEEFTSDVVENHLLRAAVVRVLGAPGLSPQTRRLAIANGFLYDSDDYNDDLPYWVAHEAGHHLVLPYAFDTNDMRFASSPGFNTGQDYYEYLRDTFDVLYREGVRKPRMMSVELHCRLAGRPGRVAALERFIEHVLQYDDVWIARRCEIAQHWHDEHAPPPP